MIKNKSKTKRPALQTGKTLPRGVSSYSPSHSRYGNPAAAIQGAELPVPRKKSRLWKRILLCIILVIFLAAAGLAVWDARNISAASQKMFGSGNLLELFRGGDLRGSERGRVNVLLVGYSIDDPGHPGAELTDSIILLSMNKASKNGYMLSIPRDLYVKIPGSGYGKINEAYLDGGVGSLKQIVESDFDIPIDYYALVNYAAVRDSVNSLGGISVEINSPDPRGLYDPNISPADGGPLRLPNGRQAINGQTALNLTRARGEAYGSYGFPQADFDRTQHQRQVLTAIKDKLSWKLVLNPRKNSQVLNAFAANLKTDLTVSDARPLFGLFNSIPSSSLKSISLRDLNGRNYLAGYTTYYGQSALVPAAGLSDYSDIKAALSQLNQ